MSSQRVLIVGAGVSGSITAFWLARHNFEVVVIERSKAGQKLGQGIEIEEPALQVVKAMGIFDELNAVKTGELGFDLVDERARSHGRFGSGRMSLTGALELMRGDLTEVLYKAADESANVTYRFETTIQSLRQTEDKVAVTLQDRGSTNSTTTEEFDLVIGADGARSRTRQLVMGSPEELNCYRSVGAFVAYFSIPKEERDWPNSRACNFPGRRVAWLRPTRPESDATSVYFIHLADDAPALRRASAAGDRRKQKEALAEAYAGLGWEMPRILEHMMKADNFYSEELVQVKLDRWSRRRVVLVGDAAWAPTPMTGEGNQLAIIGAWVLAQELSRDRSPAAFEKYESRLRAYVEESQNIPLGGYAPYMCIPQTMYGIWTFRAIVYCLSWIAYLIIGSGLIDVLPKGQENHFDLQIEDVDDTKKVR